EEHDYQVKLKQLHVFLEKGNKVKLNLFYRGRELSHEELGKGVVERFIQDTQGKGIVEKAPLREGKVLSTMFAPAK
ncbi:MAG: translation initiation factor IF-3, partial [Candidatus Omnitrophica bacterium]|nr:translation initiation factor IF-3 [Candidatus Omnitrophota bacterium]